MTKIEKKFVQGIFYDLVSSHRTFLHDKNYKGVKILRHADPSMNFEEIKKACEVLGIQTIVASEDKYFRKELDATKENDTWLFSFSEAFNKIMI